MPTGAPARHRAAHSRTPPPPPAPAQRGRKTARGFARRAWYLLCGLLVLSAVGLYLARGSAPASPAASGKVTSLRTSASCDPVTAGSGASCAGRPFHAAVASVPAWATSPPSSPARARRHPGRPAPTPSPPATPTPSASATGSPGATLGSPAAQVLALINQARAAAGLPPLTIAAALDSSASAHTMTMAGGCGLSHQCPGEPSLGARETAAGVAWTACGENIGEGGPVADSTAAIAQMAVGLTQDMLNEQPPDDGHRLNILSSFFTHIGIAVYRSPSGTVWLTQDFSN